MPAKSRQQFKLMAAEAYGKGDFIKSMSDKEAAEYIKENKGKKAYKKLPKFTKLKKMIGK